MKRLLFILIAFVFISTGCKTNPGVSKAFSKYAHEDGVTSITVPGWLISIGASFADLSEAERDLLDCIDKVKVLTVENKELNDRINLHEEFHLEINKDNTYEELLAVREKNEDITIFGKMDEEVIKEMVVLVGGDDNVLIYLRGHLEPEIISKTIDLSDPGNFLSMKF